MIFNWNHCPEEYVANQKQYGTLVLGQCFTKQKATVLSDDGEWC
jgi:hypothetical protein